VILVCGRRQRQRYQPPHTTPAHGAYFWGPVIVFEQRQKTTGRHHATPAIFGVCFSCQRWPHPVSTWAIMFVPYCCCHTTNQRTSYSIPFFWNDFYQLGGTPVAMFCRPVSPLRLVGGRLSTMIFLLEQRREILCGTVSGRL
jgi:hypothetical protein